MLYSKNLTYIFTHTQNDDPRSAETAKAGDFFNFSVPASQPPKSTVKSTKPRLNRSNSSIRNAVSIVSIVNYIDAVLKQKVLMLLETVMTVIYHHV